MKITKDERKEKVSISTNLDMVSNIIRIRNMIQENRREWGRKERMMIKGENKGERVEWAEKIKLRRDNGIGGNGKIERGEWSKEEKMLMRGENEDKKIMRIREWEDKWG